MTGYDSEKDPNQAKMFEQNDEGEEVKKYSLQDVKDKFPNLKPLLAENVWKNMKPGETPGEAWNRMRGEDGAAKGLHFRPGDK